MGASLKQSWQKIMLWSLVGIALISNILVMVPSLSNGQFPSPVGYIAVFACMIFVGVHCCMRYGWKGLLVALGICLVVANIFENLGVLTSFPFGHYHYVMMANARIFKVPLVIGFSWFTMGYVCWTVGDAILGAVSSNPRSKYTLFALPAVSAFIMCMWDVCMDAIASTVSHSWVWENGGGYFGVPLSNFIGWYFCVWIFYQLFATYLYYKKDSVVTEGPLIESKTFYLPAIAFYLNTGLGFVSLLIKANLANEMTEKIIDATGKVWFKGDVFETAVIVFLFTMLPISVIAAIRVFKDNLSGAKALKSG